MVDLWQQENQSLYWFSCFQMKREKKLYHKRHYKKRGFQGIGAQWYQTGDHPQTRQSETRV